MSTTTPPATDLRLVVGYDGSAPASRALDAAVSLLRGTLIEEHAGSPNGYSPVFYGRP